MTVELGSFASRRVVSGLLRNVLDVLRDPVIVLDQEQRVRYFSARAEQSFGYGADEVLGRPLAELFPPFAADHNAILHRALADGAPPTLESGQDLEIVGRRGDGAMFAADASFGTHRYRSRTYFTMLLRHLLVRRAVAEVASRARKSATSERTAALVHALRNQLCVVTMGVETLEMSLAPEDAELRAVVADMRSAASSGTGVVQRLLDLSRVAWAADEAAIRPSPRGRALRRRRPGALW
jgi:PAS domain S-box-containing protein